MRKELNYRCPFVALEGTAHPSIFRTYLTTQMLSSVAALTNGYTSPMAMPQSRVAASMDASADLKALAKSLNPVVVSRCARIACTATVSHPGLLTLTLTLTRCAGLLRPAEPGRGRVLGADQRGDHRLAAPC
jgi:hypothetical protein